MYPGYSPPELEMGQLLSWLIATEKGDAVADSNPRLMSCATLVIRSSGNAISTAASPSTRAT